MESKGKRDSASKMPFIEYWLWSGKFFHIPGSSFLYRENILLVINFQEIEAVKIFLKL